MVAGGEKRRGVTVTDAVSKDHVHVTTPSLPSVSPVSRTGLSGTSTSSTAVHVTGDAEFVVALLSHPQRACSSHYTRPESGCQDAENSELSVRVSTLDSSRRRGVDSLLCRLGGIVSQHPTGPNTH